MDELKQFTTTVVGLLQQKSCESSPNIGFRKKRRNEKMESLFFGWSPTSRE